MSDSESLDIQEMGNSSGSRAGCSPGALTDPYGLAVQGVLAVLAFLSLVLKRSCEPSKVRRPWLVWFFDTSKQLTGAAVIHILNVFVSELFRGDPCTFYFISFLLDSSIGLLFIYGGVKLVSLIAQRRHYETLKFGDYGAPPQCRPWFHQCLVFVILVVAEKIGVTILMQLEFWRQVREVILSPITSPTVELFIVLLVVPLILNTFMFWVVDNFTMRKVLGITNGTGGANVSPVKRFGSIDDGDFESTVALLDPSSMGVPSVSTASSDKQISLHFYHCSLFSRMTNALS